MLRCFLACESKLRFSTQVTAATNSLTVNHELEFSNSVGKADGLTSDMISRCMIAMACLSVGELSVGPVVTDGNTAVSSLIG